MSDTHRPENAAEPARGVVLLGLRGAGKSTVGPLLAARLGVGFIELDERTAAAMGRASAAEAIERDGLPAFRAAETGALRAALSEERTVLALGGGTPTAPGAAELLRSRSRTGAVMMVYLRLTPGELRARLAGCDLQARPSLTGRGTLEEIEQVFAERDPLYVALADAVIEAGVLPPAVVVDRIVGLAASHRR